MLNAWKGGSDDLCDFPKITEEFGSRTEIKPRFLDSTLKYEAASLLSLYHVSTDWEITLGILTLDFLGGSLISLGLFVPIPGP